MFTPVQGSQPERTCEFVSNRKLCNIFQYFSFTANFMKLLFSSYMIRYWQFVLRFLCLILRNFFACSVLYSQHIYSPERDGGNYMGDDLQSKSQISDFPEIKFCSNRAGVYMIFRAQQNTMYTLEVGCAQQLQPEYFSSYSDN